MAAIFEQAVLSVEDPRGFGVVHDAVETAYSQAQTGAFLRSVERAGFRVRDFQAVLGAKLLGEDALSEYKLLGNADQGQIREFYLASLERVAPELRDKFFKLYAYY